MIKDYIFFCCFLAFVYVFSCSSNIKTRLFTFCPRDPTTQTELCAVVSYVMFDAFFN